jgi:excisionase family DNA binding protein
MTRLLTLAEVRDTLRLSQPTVARILQRGELPVVRIGRRTFVQDDDLAAFIAARRTLPQNDDDPAGTGSSVRASGGETPGHAPAD